MRRQQYSRRSIGLCVSCMQAVQAVRCWALVRTLALHLHLLDIACCVRLGWGCRWEYLFWFSMFPCLSGIVKTGHVMYCPVNCSISL